MISFFSSIPKTFIIIGYGNPLRGDDGIGQRVAETVESWNFPHIKAKAIHQLTPELVEDLIKVDGAIFVDACVCSQTDSIIPLKIESINPAKFSRLIMGHTSNPRSLLAFTKALYDYYPHSWLISVPGVNFELSETLSPLAQKGVDLALEKIQEIMENPQQFYEI